MLFLLSISLSNSCGQYPIFQTGQELCSYLVAQTKDQCTDQENNCIQVSCYGNGDIGHYYLEDCEENNPGAQVKWVTQEAIDSAEVICEDTKDAGLIENECEFTDSMDQTYQVKQTICLYNEK